ncbi:endoxylanase precursor, partial [gut metagenome]
MDGKMDEEAWQDVYDISGAFHYPWEAKEAPFTAFKAYHDGTNFYFGFEVKDADVLQDENWNEDESTVDGEDRVELFFAGGSVDKPGPKGMELYYGVEIDPKGRVHDYSIEYYRHFDGQWNLEGLETAATTSDDGYVVEGMVPLKSLQDLNLIRNDVMRTGVYRAEFSTPAKEGDDPIMEWISWVDPKTAEPDYHVDSSFGEF